MLVMVVFLLYFFSLIYPDSERYIYNNELFAILGLSVIVIPSIAKKIITKKLYPLFLFVMYGLFLLFFSIPQIAKTGLYLSIRTMPVWYSVFAFFLGAYCLNKFSTKEIMLISNKLRKVSWIGLFITPFKLSPQVIFSLSIGGKFIPFFFFMLLFFLVKPALTTITGMLVGAAFLFWMKSKEAKILTRKKFIISASVLLFLSIYFMKPILDKFLIVGYDGFSGDNNATWRLMFWTYLFNEKFLQSPFYGIGFGAPLFDIYNAPKFITSDDGSRLTEYTLGAHNSFFYTGIRMGGVGLILLIWSTVSIYSYAAKCIKKIRQTPAEGVLISIILANLMFLNAAFFNVIMESPLYASNYWFTLGLMYSFAKRIHRDTAS